MQVESVRERGTCFIENSDWLQVGVIRGRGARAVEIRDCCLCWRTICDVKVSCIRLSYVVKARITSRRSCHKPYAKRCIFLIPLLDNYFEVPCKNWLRKDNFVSFWRIVIKSCVKNCITINARPGHKVVTWLNWDLFDKLLWATIISALDK